MVGRLLCVGASLRHCCIVVEMCERSLAESTRDPGHGEGEIAASVPRKNSPVRQEGQGIVVGPCTTLPLRVCLTRRHPFILLYLRADLGYKRLIMQSAGDGQRLLGSL